MEDPTKRTTLPAKPGTSCHGCGTSLPPTIKGNSWKWCGACRRKNTAQKDRDRHARLKSVRLESKLLSWESKWAGVEACKECGKDFHPFERGKFRGRRSYCSTVCATNRTRRVDREKARASRRPEMRTAEERAEYNRARGLRRGFGLTVEEFEAKAAKQGGVCAICFEVRGLRSAILVVDHDHSFHPTDKRGHRDLLCGRCNTALGMMDESVEYITSMAKYARKWKQLRLVSSG